MMTVQDFTDEWTHFLDCLDFETSTLDARAINFMNNFPGEVIQALATQKQLFKTFENLQSVYEQCKLDRVEHETSHPHV